MHLFQLLTFLLSNMVTKYFTSETSKQNLTLKYFSCIDWTFYFYYTAERSTFPPCHPIINYRLGEVLIKQESSFELIHLFHTFYATHLKDERVF